MELLRTWSSSPIHLTGFLLLGSLFLQYIFFLKRYHKSHQLEENGKIRLPPEYPFLIPFLGPLLQVWWNHRAFLFRVSYVFPRMLFILCRPKILTFFFKDLIMGG